MRVRELLHTGCQVRCPICGGHWRGFLARRGRPGVECPRCGAWERHRLLWLWLERCTDLLRAEHRVLHVSPEPAIARRLRDEAGLDYLSIDLEPGAAMEAMDLTAIRRPDDSFDVVLCSHVLEHVPDDRGAMRELRRVLRSGGWGVIQVPMLAPSTHEDATLTDPSQRALAFSQPDHVRVYGPDFLDRLRDSGFGVEALVVRDIFSEAERRRFGLRHEIPGIDPDDDRAWTVVRVS